VKGSVSATILARASSTVITRNNACGRLPKSLDSKFFALQSLASYAGLYEEPMTGWMSQFCSGGGVGIPGNEIEDELARTLACLRIEAPSSERTPLPMIPFNPGAMGQQIQAELQAMKERWWSWCQGGDASLTPPYIFLGATVLDRAFEEVIMPKVEGRSTAEVLKKKRKRWVSEELVANCSGILSEQACFRYGLRPKSTKQSALF
jgi:hypothetical protein